MDPVLTKILEGIPYSGMGSTLERNALIGYIRNLINQDKYTVEMILSLCESVGYSRQMAEDVFKELTGLSPKLIVNNNAYYDMPAGVPNMCIAWGVSKSTKDKAYFIVPFEYGYATMETDGINAPIPTVISATIPEAFDELKKVAKNIQTLDKIITKKLLETENVQSPANDVHQVNLPYSASPLQVLKKSFKDKVLSVSEFERQASKMLQAGELTVDEAEDLMNWKQDLIDEDDSYANEVLENNEKWNEVQATVEFDDIYNELKEIARHDDEYGFNKDKVRAIFEANKDMFQEVDLIEAVNRLYQLLLGFSKEEILGHSEFKGKQASHLDKEQKDYNKAFIAIQKSGISKDTPLRGPLLDSLFEELDLDTFSMSKDDFEYWINLLEDAKSNIGIDASLKQASKWGIHRINEKEEKALNVPVKTWYINKYKTDNLGEEINSDVTFLDIFNDIKNTDSLLGVTDGSVRRKIFTEISNITTLPYDYLDHHWYGANFGKRRWWNRNASKKVKAEKLIVDVYDIDWYEDDKNEWNEGLWDYDELPDFEDSLEIEVNNKNDDYAIYHQIKSSLEITYGHAVGNFHYRIKSNKQASKKVTAENMTLDDIEAEDNKDQVQKEIEKIDETPAEDIFAETTPEQYFDKALQEDKVDTINDVVSKCIDKFSEKFKDFDKYQVKILSYNTKVLGDYEPTEDELVEDKELNANAILEVILQITNNADEASNKKVLAVFSITNGQLHWTGTVRGENDQVVAFTEEGLDALFEVEEVTDQELEDII